MKKNISVAPVACVLSLALLFSSCFKDTCRHTYKLFTPVYQKLTALRASVQNRADVSIVKPGKLYIRGNWIFLNEQNQGIHVIDNSNPAHPVKTTFINIPGNIDMAIKGNILYADLYCDLAAINISDPAHITIAKYLTNTFPEKSSSPGITNPDSINIITDWISRDTTVDCNAPTGFYPPNVSYAGAPAAFQNSSVSTGTAGSTARFAPVNNYLYTVGTNNLSVVDINEAANPLFVQSVGIGWNIETIFPYNNRLYIGAGNSMSVYDLQDPVNPQQLSWYGHWCSHDPVVADDNYAYVTLHQANVCNSISNELDIYNLNINAPALVRAYPMANPQGLSKDGSLLFVCDEGIKIYDVTNVGDITLIKHLTGIETSDVIAANGIAYVLTKDGLYQYDYSDRQNIYLLSKLLK